MLFLVNPGPQKRGAPRRRKGGDPIVSNVAIAGGRRRVTTKSGRTWTIGGRGGKAKSASHKGGTTMATRKKGRTAAQKAATRKMLAANKRKGRKSTKSKGKSRWSSRTARKTPAKSRRYSFRKSAGKRGKVFRTNPPRLSLNSMVSATVDGAKDAVAVIAGQVATRFIRSRIPVGGGTMVQVGLGVVSALAAGYAAGMVAPKYARTVIAGGLSDVIRPFLAQVPLVGEGLAGEPDFLGIGADRFLGAYAGDDLSSDGMGAYPALSGDSGMGAYAD